MRNLSTRLLRPLLGAALLCSAATMAGAQQAPAPAAGEATVKLTQEERVRYVGVYEASTPDGPLRIHVYEEGVRVLGRPENDDQPSPLIPLGEHRFRPEMAGGAVITFTLEEGRVTRFTIVFPDERGTVVAVRRP